MAYRIAAAVIFGLGCAGMASAQQPKMAHPEMLSGSEQDVTALPEPSTIAFYSSPGTPAVMTIDLKTRTITVAADVKADDAARRVIAAMRNYIPNCEDRK